MLRHNEIILRDCKVNLQTRLIIQPNKITNHIWIITDGKAGDQNPCIGVVKALNGSYILKTIRKSIVYQFLSSNMVKNAPQFSAPFPEIIIASGRSAAPIMRAIKIKSPQTFCVFLKNPYLKNSGADIVWQPSHDTKLQENAITSILSPNHLQFTPYVESKYKQKIIGILVGGNSKHAKWTNQCCLEFIQLLQRHADNPNITLKILPSRRTPQVFQNALQHLCVNTRHEWCIPNSSTHNPYAEILQQADALIVTADSVNMMSESLARGCNVYIFAPRLKKGRIKNHVAALIAEKLVKPLGAHIEFGAQDALNVTPALALYIANAYEEFKNKVR